MPLPFLPASLDDEETRKLVPFGGTAAIPPEVAAFVSKDPTYLPRATDYQGPTATDELSDAMASDRKSAGMRALGDVLSNSAALMRGERAPPLQPSTIPSEVQAWAAKQQADKAAREDAWTSKMRTREESLWPMKDAAERQKMALDALKGPAEVRKALADANKSEAEAGKIGEDAKGAAWLNAPASPQTKSFAASLGLKLADSATNREAKDAIDPWLKKQGLDLDWSKLGLEKDKFAQQKGPQQGIELRKEFQNQQVYKDTQQVATMYGKIQSASPTAAGDLSLVYGYMKILDPGSMVKETEQATAENARGVPASVRNVWNKLLSGERLDQAQRGAFRGEATRLLGAQMSRYNSLADEYRRLATQQGVRPEDVVLDLGIKPDAPAKKVVSRVSEPGTGKTLVHYDDGSFGEE